MKKRMLLLGLITLSLCLNAQDFEQYTRTASELMSRGEFNDALNNYQKAISLIDDSTSQSVVYAYAAMCAKEVGNASLAKAYFLESIDRGIEEPQVFDALGEIARREKDYSTQVLAYQVGLERVPSEREKYLLKLCIVYRKQKNAEKLLLCANSVLEIDGQNLKALEYKGTALQYQKKMTDAEAIFKTIYSIDPENINANIFLGNYYYQVGKSELNAARKEYDKISNPSRVQWHEHNEASKVLMARYYEPATLHLGNVYAKRPSKNIGNMLFVMYSKMGENEKAEYYKTQ